MGRANRALARCANADRAELCQHHAMPRPSPAKSLLTGNPVRDRVRVAAGRPIPRSTATAPIHLARLRRQPGRAGVFRPRAAGHRRTAAGDSAQRLRIVQQCRAEDLDRVTEAYRQAKVNVELQPFFTDLPERMAAAHLVIARSGASTVAELTRHRPAGHPRAAARRDRCRPEEQCAGARRLPVAAGSPSRPRFRRYRLALACRHFSVIRRHCIKAAAAAKSLGQPDAVEKLADARRTPRPEGDELHEDAAQYRSGALRRHRRHRHERHCRNPAQPGLQGPRLRQRREPQCAAPARHGDRGRHRPDGREPQGRRRRRHLLGDQEGQSRAGRRPCRAACRWCAGPKCSPRSCGSRTPSPSAARTARPRPRRWSRRCSMPATWIRRSSMAASSMPMAPMPASAMASGWWSRPTRATAPSSSCRPTSPSSPISIPSISTTTAISTEVKQAFLNFVENVPFYGFAVMCLDHPEVQALVGQIRDRRVITYGRNPQADVRLVDLENRDGVQPFRRRNPRPHPHDASADRGARTADAGRAQRAQRHRGHRRRRSAQGAGRGDPQGPQGFLGRQAALHPDRHCRRHHHHRRLWPPPGRDFRGAEGGAPVDPARRHRRGAAAPLQPRQRSVQRVRHLLQRCRHRASSRRSMPPARRRSTA